MSQKEHASDTGNGDVSDLINLAETWLCECLEDLFKKPVLLRQESKEVLEPRYPAPLEPVGLYQLSILLLTKLNRRGWFEDLMNTSTITTSIQVLINKAEARRKCANLGRHNLYLSSLYFFVKDELAPNGSAPGRNYDLENIQGRSDTSDTLFVYYGSIRSEKLYQSVYLYRYILRSLPYNHSQRPFVLFGLSRALQTIFLLNGQTSNLHGAVLLLKKAMKLQPYPNLIRTRFLLSLSLAMLMTYKKTADKRHLIEGLEWRNKANEEESEVVNLLRDGDAMIQRSLQFHTCMNMLDEAVCILHCSLSPLASSSIPVRCEPRSENMAILIIKNTPDSENSIRLYHRTMKFELLVETNYVEQLSNSANEFLDQLKSKSDSKPEDLEESINLYRKALDLISKFTSKHHYTLGDLAARLLSKSQKEVNLASLDESIISSLKALDLISPVSFHREDILLTLANALEERFFQTGNLEDLKESIEIKQQSLGVMSTSDPKRPLLINAVANALLTRFMYITPENTNDFDESIHLHNLALRKLLEGESSDRAIVLLDLSIALAQGPNNNYLQKAIRLAEKGVKTLPTNHSQKTTALNTLACVLVKRYLVKSNLSDLQKAITMFRQALPPQELQTINALSPQAAGISGNLATALALSFKTTGNFVDLGECIEQFHKAIAHQLGTNSIFECFQFLKNWTTIVKPIKIRYYHDVDADDHSITLFALDAYKYMIDLLPRLASLDRTVQQRHRVLIQARGLACDAAWCAIQNKKLELAVEILSAGRSVFWSQALHLRTPLDQLAQINPMIAQELQELSISLETASLRPDYNHFVLSSKERMELEERLASHRMLNQRWEHTLEKVRQLLGFEDFMKPIPFSKLRDSASKGPVIMLNANTAGCDALIMTTSEVRHVPLRIAFSKLEDLRKHIQSFSKEIPSKNVYRGINRGLERGPDRGVDRGERPENCLSYVLKTLWIYVVKPIILELRLEKLETPKRVWWCPAGPFVFLPIHAAGIYEEGHIDCALDYCVSSYIPIPQNLLTPPIVHDHNYSFKMLAVIQAKVSGTEPLRGTLEELQKIETHVPDKLLVKLGMEDGEPSSLNNVLTHLPDSPFVHFGCHGRRELDNPLQSGLSLADKELTIADILKYRAKNASLAYLSACETARGEDENPDEAMHIAATMLFTGFRGVVGTMWSIDDEDAPRVADAFYGYLFRDILKKNPDPSEAAIALHLAVKKLGIRGDMRLQSWVPFIHLGI